MDRQDLLKTLAESCQKTDWQVHAYCLMRNHFHLVLETPNANLVDGMRWFLSAYTIRLNHRQKLWGHVFSGRYKALIVEGSGNGYLKTACDYVHLNPVRAHLLGSEERLLAYPWSSFGWYLAAPDHRPGWMRVDRLLGEHGIQQDSAAGRQEFERHMEARRLEEADEEELKPLRRGWCLGSEQFRQEMLERMDGKLGRATRASSTARPPSKRPTASSPRSFPAGAGPSPIWPLAGAATRASWPSLSGSGTKPLCRSSGLRRGCKLARPKGRSPCSIGRAVAPTISNPREPMNHAHNWNSNLRFDPFSGRVWYLRRSVPGFILSLKLDCVDSVFHGR